MTLIIVFVIVFSVVVAIGVGFAYRNKVSKSTVGEAEKCDTETMENAKREATTIKDSEIKITKKTEMKREETARKEEKSKIKESEEALLKQV